MMDDPLDFELDDPLTRSPVPAKKRRKIIGLDDLLNDYYKEQKKVTKKESKQTKKRMGYDSDDSDDAAQATREAKLSQVVDKCENQFKELSSEEENSSWGIPVFGNQIALSYPAFSEIENCRLLQSFLKDELNSLDNFSTEEGETFLEGLLVNGWLVKLVLTFGHAENCITEWVLNLTLYSSKVEVMSSACDFCCAILASKNMEKIGWFPGYAELKNALEKYGFNFNLSTYTSSSSELVQADSDNGGPPHNIRAWVKLITTCCRMRSSHPIFSTSEAEELLEVVIFMFLDRKLQGLSLLMHECLLSVTNYFTDEEWDESCEKVAKNLACRVPRDLNCLRIVECISGVNMRSKLLKRAVAFEFLIKCFDNKVTDAEEILSFLISINVKEKHCNLFMMYIYLVLTENWLMRAPLSRNTEKMHEKWDKFLRNCSQINMASDWRSYASKVRSKVSYLASCLPQGDAKR